MKKKRILVLIIFCITITGCKKELKNYTINFDSAGGTNIENQVVKENEKISLKNNPTKEGYKFACWKVEGENTCYDTNKEIKQNLNLIAVWKKSK